MFLAALAVPRGERAALLAERCGGDAGLRHEVEELLLHHELAGGGSALPGDDAVSPGEDDVPATLGDFRVLGVLGRGGMGLVCRAQRGAESPVALKVLRPGLLSPDLLARFSREAEALARLDHPGIARLLETGTLETPAGPRPYFAMELVEGEDLRAWARRPHALEEKLEVLARVCDAVDHAHAHGVVHRDLKPENVLVRDDGGPCVLDFGVARLAGLDRLAAVAMTSTGVLVGTVRYMSPEQADPARGEVDARTDVYSLGVVAHELLSGTMPYDVPADSLHRALVAVLTSPPRPLPQVEGARGRHLETVLARALAKPPAERYASAAELAAELRRVAAGARPHARRPHRPGGRTRLLLPALLVALAAVVAVALLPPGVGERARTLLSGAGGPDGGRRAIELLDAASVGIYSTPRDEAAVRLGIARCDSAVRLLADAPDRAVRAPLERIAWGMAMDAHLWLGDHDFDGREYEACIAAAERALRLAEPGVPARGEPALARLAEQRSRGAHAVMALAACKLAALERPWSRQQQALAWNGAALARLEPPAGATPADSEEAARFDVTRRLLRNERGGMLVQAGALADSAALVLEGLRLLEASLAAGPGAAGVRMMAPVFLRSGAAWAELARIEGHSAAFDSALAHLSLAVGRSRSAARGPLEANSRILLAETLRWRARTRGSREAAERDLRAALAPLERRLAEPAGALHERYRALLGAERAEIRLDLAALAASPALVESALAELDSVLPLFTAAAYPVVRADVEVARARAQALLWALRGDPAMRDAARRGLAAAARLVPGREDPRRARRIRAGLAALERGRREPADLWRPVASGPLSAARFDSLTSGGAPRR